MEPVYKVEETSFTEETIKQKNPDSCLRDNSLPDYFIKEERKNKSKNVAFITSYNGLILQ